MKLVIHLGFHKTGSSALQAFCRRNRDRLALDGLLYPTSTLATLRHPSTPSSEAGHRQFANVLVTPTNSGSRSAISAIVEEAGNYPDVRTVLVSSETFSAPKVKISTAAPDTLLEYFDEIELLAYLRRQDDWSESFYREVLCWSGRSETRSFNRFRNEFLPLWLDYGARLDQWARVFGADRLVLKSYDDRSEADIVKDCLEGMGVNLAGPEHFHSVRGNPSLPVDLVTMMHDINRMKLDKAQRSMVTQRLFEELAVSSCEVDYKPLLTAAQRSDFAREFGQQNLALCRSYGVENHAGLCFEVEREPPASEISLSPAARDEIIRYAGELIERRRDQRQKMKSRPDLGRVGLSCLLSEKPDQVRLFVAYHLAIGISRIRLYFDKPDDPMLEFDFGDDRVECIACTDEFWIGKLGRMPANNGEKLSTCHEDGLNYLNRLDDIDWAINLDADELLFVAPGVPLSTYLAGISKRYDQIRIRPLEAVFVTEDDTRLFAARYFKVPRMSFIEKPEGARKGILVRGYFFVVAIARFLSGIRLIRWSMLRFSATAGIFLAWSDVDEEIYRTHKPVLSKVIREGFLGHRLGRMFTRHGVELDAVKSHAPGRSDGDTRVKWFSNTIFVLHFDAADYSAWYLKWYRRIFGDTTSAAIHDKRRMQQDMFREAVGKGDREVRRLFDDLYLFSESAIEDLARSGLVVKCIPPHLEDIRKELGI